MWTNNRLTKLLAINLPIIQAPMAGGATTPELIAAVSNAGGLGSLGAGFMPADAIKQTIHDIRALTDKPFAVNLFIVDDHHASDVQLEAMRKQLEKNCAELAVTVPNTKPPYAPSFAEQIQVIIDEQVPIFSFTFGIPKQQWLDKLKENHIKMLGTATTLTEAKKLEHAGVDVIVAQGSEAGGHRGTFLQSAENSLQGNFSLIPQIADQIDCPLVAAGGIMDARGITAALALGASGVQMGTAFLSCPESGIHPSYKKILLDQTQDNTTLTKVFSGKMARGIRNTFIDRMEKMEDPHLAYPIQNKLTKAIRQEAAAQNNAEFMSLWAGQSACLSKGINAHKLVQELKEGVDRLIKAI